MVSAVGNFNASAYRARKDGLFLWCSRCFKLWREFLPHGFLDAFDKKYRLVLNCVIVSSMPRNIKSTGVLRILNRAQANNMISSSVKCLCMLRNWLTHFHKRKPLRHVQCTNSLR